MIIDSNYFLTKELFIPNAVSQPSIGSNTPTSKQHLEDVIQERESELLLKFLGHAQYTDLQSQFEANGDWKPTADQKWKDLVDGKDEWRGLRYTIGTKKVSLIAFYVFFYYLKSDFSTYSTTGVNVANAENANNQIPNQKQVSAWNTFVQMFQGNNRIGTSYRFSHNWNGTMLRWSGSNGNSNSLYNFMSKNSDVYDTSFFNFQSIINPYNL